ncbi:MAG: hypothetical protein JRJ56_04665 [Deltaproteobacteria bacterium]|nr:hypothetical protein [Deltaproteobacteria bacterium]
MTSGDYREAGRGRKVRLRLTVTPEGLEIIGDSLHVAELELLLAFRPDCRRQPAAAAA